LIEFEHGDANFPIWVGAAGASVRHSGEGLPVSPSIILQTAGQNVIISDPDQRAES
jgi:hypothetical protein